MKKMLAILVVASLVSCGYSIKQRVEQFGSQEGCYTVSTTVWYKMKIIHAQYTWKDRLWNSRELCLPIDSIPDEKVRQKKIADDFLMKYKKAME